MYITKLIVEHYFKVLSPANSNTKDIQVPVWA